LISCFKGVAEAFPDAQWKIDSARMFTINKIGKDSYRESVRVIVGHFSLRGQLISFVLCAPLHMIDTLIVASGTMVSPIFADQVESKFKPIDGLAPGMLELQQQRPKVLRNATLGMFMYFLRPSKESNLTNRPVVDSSHRNDEVETFYALFHTITKDVSIAGVSEKPLHTIV
jgi:hypothetical protein